MSTLLHVIVIYLVSILPLYYLYNRSYLWECFAPMMALIWPVSLPFVISFNVYCFVSEKRYQYKHRNDPKVDWAEVFKDGPMMAEIPVPKPVTQKASDPLEVKPADRI
ncbi:hypothetical protein [Pseudomonas amygdali]|uniref:hypothetical protein n=1 Tax=Pseudomonas amygdali TaxID=47877 RepID=UPI000208CFDB|nr:hypothetical protein [Pseudomonas amygdali]RMT05755.1 hypothetical protein ALP54_03589 [Pseudomonas amygdali pv. lachrymans]